MPKSAPKSEVGKFQKEEAAFSRYSSSIHSGQMAPSLIQVSFVKTFSGLETSSIAFFKVCLQHQPETALLAAGRLLSLPLTRP